MKLTEPIETSIDHEARAAYVTFHAFAPGENVRCLRLEHDVVVEFNAADEGARFGVARLRTRDNLVRRCLLSAERFALSVASLRGA